MRVSEDFHRASQHHDVVLHDAMEVFTFDLSHASMSDKAHRGGRGAEPADIRNLSPKDTGLEALSEVTIVSCKIGLELSSGAFRPFNSGARS